MVRSILLAACALAAGAPAAAETTEPASPGLLFIQGWLQPGQEETYERYLAGTRPLMDEYGAEVLVIGDSILEGFRLTGVELGGSSTTYDTEVGRQISVLGERIDAARDDGSLAPVVIIHLGTNGWPSGADSLLATELASLDEHEVILVDVHADRSWTASANAAIHRNAERFEHVRLVRWSTIAVAGDHLRSDGVHPSASGRLALGTALVDLLRTSP